MPDAVFVKTWKAIQTAIAVNYAAGYSGLNLTNRVIRGAIPEAPMLPYASIFLLDNVETAGPVLTRYSGKMIFEIYAFAAGSDVTSRTDNALNLGADIINALTADRSLGLAGAIDDLICSIAALDGDRLGVPSSGVAFLNVSVTFQSDRGV